MNPVAGGNDMPVTFAFDVYGPLIDTHGLVSNLEKIVGEQAAAFSNSTADAVEQLLAKAGMGHGVLNRISSCRTPEN